MLAFILGHLESDTAGSMDPETLTGSPRGVTVLSGFTSPQLSCSPFSCLPGLLWVLGVQHPLCLHGAVLLLGLQPWGLSWGGQSFPCFPLSALVLRRGHQPSHRLPGSCCKIDLNSEDKGEEAGRPWWPPGESVQKRFLHSVGRNEARMERKANGRDSWKVLSESQLKLGTQAIV